MKHIKQTIDKTLAIFFLITVLGMSEIAAQGWIRNFTDSTDLEAFAVTSRGASGNIAQGIGLGIPGQPSQDYSLVLLDSDGVLLWKKKWKPFNFQWFTGNDMLITKDEGIVIGGLREDGQNTNAVLLKIDDSGNELWNLILSPQSTTISHLAENNNKEIVCIWHTVDFFTTNAINIMRVSESGTIISNKQVSLSSSYDLKEVSGIEVNTDQTYTVTLKYSLFGQAVINQIDLLRINSNGNVLSNVTISNPNKSLDLGKAKLYPNGDYLVAYRAGETRLRKIESNGTVAWDVQVPIAYDVEDMEIDKNGEIYLIGYYADGIEEGQAIFKTDAFGGYMWSKRFQDLYQIAYLTDIDLDQDGFIYVGGTFWYYNQYPNFEHHTVLKLNEDGNVYSGFIKGNALLDMNQNCTVESTDIPIPNYKVMAFENFPYIEYTDAQGNYFMNVDTGTYEVKTIPNNTLNSLCGGPVTVQVMEHDTIEIDFLETPSAFCPHMMVDISTPFITRCFSNTYYVNYCNNGSATANNVYIDVTLDPYMTYLSSSIPPIPQTGNTYMFDIGTVDMFECGSFTIEVEVDCDSTVLGQTHCVEAHIYPDSICTQSATSWDGSITALNASCQTDSVLLEITNTGMGDMAAPQNYIITEDDIIKTSFTYQLLVGEVLALTYPANGSTYRLTAYQSPGHFPSNYIPTIAIEGCGFDSTTMQFSTGFITQFNEDDVLDYLSIDCQENVGSFDPNDKRAEPKGYGPEHYIEANTDIEYHIRFQNVGTAPAYTVLIRDELSPHLDASSIRLGVSSHPYDFSLVNGNMMKFTFNNINLPDSTSNEPGSHGFVKFKIAQQPNLPLETVINNSAAIYFDFNEPVITNTTFHKIGKDFIQVVINNEEVTDYPAAQVNVYPNPFSETATLEITDGPAGIKTFTMHDALGRTVRQDEFETSFQFDRKNLLAGIYFFTIEFDGNNIKQGKLIIQ